MVNTRIRLQIYLIIFISVFLIGVFGISYTERLPLMDAIYFAIVTAATVGYGDISPQTTAGKALTIFLIIGGVGTFLGVIAGFTELLLSRREEKQRRQKLQMVTSMFFSELGSQLLKLIIQLDPDLEQKTEALQKIGSKNSNGVQDIRNHLQNFSYKVVLQEEKLNDILMLIRSKATFLLRLLENPLFLEQDLFGDLLRALFHLRDELTHRPFLKNLPPADCSHLEGDLTRVYRLLVSEWFNSLCHLKKHYPYLYSLALRTNPFNPNATVILE